MRTNIFLSIIQQLYYIIRIKRVQKFIEGVHQLINYLFGLFNIKNKRITFVNTNSKIDRLFLYRKNQNWICVSFISANKTKRSLDIQ